MTDSLAPSAAVRSPAGRTSAKSARRREELLDELEDIFLAEGFQELTIDELCRRLHCSKSTMYTVADSREQIVQAVTRHFFARATAIIEAELDAVQDPGQRITSYLNGVGSAMKRNSVEFYRDMLNYRPTADIYRLNSDAAAKRVQRLIEEGSRAGIFRDADARLAAQAVTLLIDGVQSGELLNATGLTAGEAFSELGELIVHGLAVQPRDAAARETD